MITYLLIYLPTCYNSMFYLYYLVIYYAFGHFFSKSTYKNGLVMFMAVWIEITLWSTLENILCLNLNSLGHRNHIFSSVVHVRLVLNFHASYITLRELFQEKIPVYVNSFCSITCWILFTYVKGLYLFT